MTGGQRVPWMVTLKNSLTKVKVGSSAQVVLVFSTEPFISVLDEEVTIDVPVAMWVS
jgi:F0F1-type ATP synthase epsilon subunit